MKRYISKLREQQDLADKVFEFFKDNPAPKDEEELHAYADSIGVDVHKFEEEVYKILGSILGAGRSKDYTGEYKAEELKKGIKVEMEHTTSKKVAERIAKDHLVEDKEYYTKLLSLGL